MAEVDPERNRHKSLSKGRKSKTAFFHNFLGKMFKKLREKITEEVQQTSLRLPVSVQQSVQQLTQV